MLIKLFRLLLLGVVGVGLALAGPAALADEPQNFANCRLGIGGAYSPNVGDYNIGQLNMGRYLDWSTRSNPASEIGLPAEVEFIQTVRVHQLKECGMHCVGDYLEPPQYSVSPNLATLASIAASRPGMLWRIGNEIDRPDWDGGGQDEITPELYATAYHAIHTAIKTADPTARVAVGSVILGSPLRLAYLNRVWNAYQTQFGYAMGQDVDAWVMHTFLIREVEGSWGANVPVGFSNSDSDPTNDYNPSDGFLYGVPEDSAIIFEKHHDLEEFEKNVRGFRTWMAQHSEQNKPLLITEYGILYRGFFGHIITSQQVKDYLTGSFDYLFAATDPALGYPRDEYRLVQGWVWYSLEDSYWNGPIFIDGQTLSEFGRTWRDYVSNPAKPLAAQPQPNLRLTVLQAAVNPPLIPLNGQAAVTLTAEIANSGNTAAAAVAVTFWDGDPANPQSQQIGVTQTLTSLAGCGAFLRVEQPWQRPVGQHPWFVKIEPVTNESNLADNVAGSSVTVNTDGSGAEADVTVGKTVNSAAPFTGDIITYTVTAINNGPNLATAVTVTEMLPPGLSLLAHNTSQGGYNSGSGVWMVGPLPPQASAALTLSARVAAGGPIAPITNTAAITAAEPDPTPVNNTAQVVINPVPNADLNLSKTVNTLNPYTGQRLTYTLAITNAGPDTATGVALLDDFPAQLVLASHTASLGVFSPATGLWQVGALAANASARLTITANIPVGLVGVAQTNAAYVSASQIDRRPGNNIDTVTVTPVGSADVRLSQTVNITAPYSADSINFSLTAVNIGPESAVEVRVQDMLPAGLAFNSFSTPHGIYSPDSGVWQIGVIPAGDTVTATLTASVAPGWGGLSLTNRAAITATGTDPLTANNQAEATIWPVAHADLSLLAAASTLVNQIAFTLTVTNFGPDTATGIETQNILLPTGLTLAGFSPNQGTFTPAAGLWAIGNLPAGQTARLTITTTVNAGMAGQPFGITNMQVWGDQPDLEPANNTRAVAADSFNTMYMPVIFKQK